MSPDDILDPFQDYGAQWLCDTPEGILGDEMRVGKTPQAIRAADLAGVERLLVVCPAIARRMWVRKLNQWSVLPRKIVLIQKGTSATWHKDRVTHVLNYDLLNRAVGKELLKGLYDAIILDEAHFLKSIRRKRTVYMYGTPTQPEVGLASRCARHWRLSGTIMPNNVGELYPHVMHRARVLLGIRSLKAWLDRFAVQASRSYGNVVIAHRNVDELSEFMAPIYLKRLASEVLANHVDPIVEEFPLDTTQSLVDLAILSSEPAVAALSASLEARAIGGLTENELLELLEEAAALQDSSAMSTFRRLTGLAKSMGIADLASMILDDGEPKVVVFAWHTQVIDAIAERLKDYSPLVLTGRTSKNKADDIIDQFQTNPMHRVIVVQILKANTAIELNAAKVAIFGEMSWVPGDNLQALMRLYQRGKPTPVHGLITYLAGTLDEALMQVYTRKLKTLATTERSIRDARNEHYAPVCLRGRGTGFFEFPQHPGRPAPGSEFD